MRAAASAAEYPRRFPESGAGVTLSRRRRASIRRSPAGQALTWRKTLSKSEFGATIFDAPLLNFEIPLFARDADEAMKVFKRMRFRGALEESRRNLAFSHINRTTTREACQKRGVAQTILRLSILHRLSSIFPAIAP
jgi:hypothetical protein